MSAKSERCLHNMRGPRSRSNEKRPPDSIDNNNATGELSQDLKPGKIGHSKRQIKGRGSTSVCQRGECEAGEAIASFAPGRQHKTPVIRGLHCAFHSFRSLKNIRISAAICTSEAHI